MTAQRLDVGWIGLGNMGSAMAPRVLEAGHRLTLWNRSRNKAQGLLDLGARWADTPAEVAACDVLVTMLADDQALRDVLEMGGALQGLKAGAIHVSMSTISHALATELTQAHARRGVHFVGAPVFGRPDAAAAGKLFVLAAGDERALTTCEALFACLSQKVLPLGKDPAAAHLSKILGNFMLISSVELLAEALNVAQAKQLDPAALLHALTSSVFTAPLYANYGRMLVAQSFEGPAAFTLPLARKDLDLALAAAKSVEAPLPVAEQVRAKLTRLIEAGGSELDLTAIGKWTA